MRNFCKIFWKCTIESHGGGAAFWLNNIAAGNGDLTSYYQARKSNWENYMASVYAQFDNYKDE